jgi:predicted MPP superfamily phosphohydrolase
MNILHISDLHYNGTSARLSEKVITRVAECVKSGGKKVDFVIFTGDLVFSATVKSHFDAAKQQLFDYLSKELGVAPNNFIFCPGNHDIDRESRYKAVRPYFKSEVNTLKELNDFYTKKDEVYKDSLRTLANYKEFVSDYHTSVDDSISDLYSVHFRSYQGEAIAFVSIYTPWLSAVWDDNGELDEGNLCYPVNALQEAIDTVGSKVKRKILLMHHPISALRKNISFEIEDLVYDNFEMLFTGHVHKMMNVARHNGENGIYEHTAKATLTKGASVGCSFIENLDYEPNKYLVSEITYIKDSDECHFGTAVEVTIPVGEERAEQIRLRSKIHDHVEPEIKNANSLLLQNDEEDENAFLTQFNTPYIKTQREDTANAVPASIISMNDLYAAETNFIIYGKDKSGKSSLLRRIQLEYLMHYTIYQRIPLYIDARLENAKIDDRYDLENVLRNYLGINKRQTTAIAQSDKLVLLIDNFRANDPFCNYLQSFLESHSGCVVFLATDDNVSNSLQIENLDFVRNREFGKVFFHNLRRQEIIKFTDENLPDQRNKVAIQEKILKLCKQMELPYNYWTISLFLLIHHKSSDAYSKNLFDILDYCVDEIFDKKRFLVKGAQITFPQIKLLTASLAAYLFEEHEATVYSASKEEIIKYLEKKSKENLRIYARPSDVFDFLLGCGMLKSQVGDTYSFRLNGFFEYFLAYQMTTDSAFKERILSDEVKYLGFKNQLEIYSGFKNDDAETLKRVYDRTVTKCEPLFAAYGDDKDAQLVKNVSIPQQLEDELKQISIQKALTPIQKAQAEDVVEGPAELRSDVHLMYQYDPSSTKIEVVERYLSILARVYKNVDNVNNNDIDTVAIFQKILDYYCDFGFYIVENIAANTKDILHGDSTVDIDETDEMRLLKMLSNMSPVLAQTFMYDGLGHYSLVRLLLMQIEELRKNTVSNQYRLFVLYFTLFDIALSEYYEMIDQAINDISKIPLLRYMMYLKINYYLAFKASGNTVLAQYLQEKAKKVRLLMNNKTDVDRLQQALSDTRKTSLINRE